MYMCMYICTHVHVHVHVYVDTKKIVKIVWNDEQNFLHHHYRSSSLLCTISIYYFIEVCSTIPYDIKYTLYYISTNLEVIVNMK